MCNKNSTSTQKSTLPAYLETTYKSLLNAGKQAATRPLVSYQGSQTAGFTPMQNQAFQQIQQTQGNWTPYVNNASNMLSNAYNMFTPGNYGNTISQYQNPYTQQVVDSTMANINRSNAIQQSQLQGQGIANGVSPNLGDRLGVASAELARNQALASNQTIAGLEQQGYTNAQQAAQQAGQFGQQAAGSMAGLGQQVQNQTGTGIGQLMNAGAQQQALTQQQLTNAYNQFQQQQQYPQQQIDWLASLAYGQPKGGTTSTTTPGPSAISQIAGLATAGAGLFGTNGMFGANGAFPNTFGGGFTNNTQPSSPYYNFERGGRTHNSGSFQFPPTHLATGGTGGPTPITAPQLDASIYSTPVTGNYDNAAPYLAPIAPPHEYWNSVKDPWVSWGGVKGQPFHNRGYQMSASGSNPLTSLAALPTWPLGAHTLEANTGIGSTGTFQPYSRGGRPRSFAHMADGGDPYRPDYGTDAGVVDPSSALAWSDPSDLGVSGSSSNGDTPPPPPSFGAGPPGAGPMTYGGGPGPARPYGGFMQSSGFPLLTMGLGMMGNASPFPGVAIGAGALEGLKLPGEIAKTQMELDAHPIVDSSTGHIMVYYPSEGKWVDTGMKSIEGQKWDYASKYLNSDPSGGGGTGDVTPGGVTNRDANPIATSLVNKEFGVPGSATEAEIATGTGPGGGAAAREYQKHAQLGSAGWAGGYTPDETRKQLNDATSELGLATKITGTNEAIRSVLKDVNQGAGGQLSADTQRLLQGLGFDTRGATANSMLDTLMKQQFQLSNELTGGINGVSIRSQREFDYVTHAFASRGNSPGANQMIINGMDNTANLVKDLATAEIQYANTPAGAIVPGTNVRKTGEAGTLDPGWDQVKAAMVSNREIMGKNTLIKSIVDSAGEKSGLGQPLVPAPGKDKPMNDADKTELRRRLAAIDPNDGIALGNFAAAVNNIYGPDAARTKLGMQY